MHSRLLAPGIRFNDSFFTEPLRLADRIAPKFPGLFAILAGDPNWAPKAFQPVCFGEFGNNSPHPLKQREYAGLWSAGSRRHLDVSVLPLPFSTTPERCALRDELVAAYHPVLQTHATGSPAADLTRRLDDLEKRHREQTAQVLLLLGNLNQQF